MVVGVAVVVAAVAFVDVVVGPVAVVVAAVVVYNVVGWPDVVVAGLAVVLVLAVLPAYILAVPFSPQLQSGKIGATFLARFYFNFSSFELSH